MKPVPLIAASSYAVATVVGLFVVPRAPGVDAPGSVLVDYYTRHAGGVRLLVWLGAVSLIPLAILFAHLRSLLTAQHRDVFLLGGALLMAATMVWLWFSAGLALHARTLDPGTAQTLTAVAAYFGPLLTVAVIMVVAPVGVDAWQGLAALPRWLAWFSAVLVLEQLVETITILSTSGFAAPGGDMNFDVGAVLYLIWIVAAGIAATRRRDLPIALSSGAA